MRNSDDLYGLASEQLFTAVKAIDDAKKPTCTQCTSKTNTI